MGMPLQALAFLLLLASTSRLGAALDVLSRLSTKVGLVACCWVPAARDATGIPLRMLCPRIHRHAHAHAHAHARTHAHTYTPMHTHARSHTRTHARRRARTHARTHTHPLTYTHVRVRAHTHTHTHTCIHTSIHAQLACACALCKQALLHSAYGGAGTLLLACKNAHSLSWGTFCPCHSGTTNSHILARTRRARTPPATASPMRPPCMSYQTPRALCQCICGCWRATAHAGALSGSADGRT